MRLLFALAALLCCASCGVYRHNPPPYRLPTLPSTASGHELFARDRAYCHGDGAQGTQRGPRLKGGTNGAALTDFVLRTGRMPLDDPNQRMQRRPVAYDSKQIDAITRYVVSLGADG